jgi:transcriptional regulator with XRE-family HTH domain
MNEESEALALARVRAQLRTGEARAIRKQAGLSQADVGRAVGSDGPQVSRWETQKSVPRRESALKLARLLDDLDAMNRSGDGGA